MKPLLEFCVVACTYNVYGGHPTLSLIPGFILTDAPAFGTAVSELTVTFHYPHSGPPRSSLERLFAEFHASRLKLPKTVFRRSHGKITIDVASQLIDGKDLDKRCGLSASLFRDGFAETITSLNLLRSRLTSKDDFSLDVFLDHCRRREPSLPDSEEALIALKHRLDQQVAETRDTLTPWERLGLDWRDFHSDARRILDDPFFWEQTNDFSPHGNDTGADLLGDYRRWLRRHPSDDPYSFYQDLMSQWGFSDNATNPLIRSAMNEAAIALAFAELKFRANCRPSVVALARAAIQRQRQEALIAADWPLREARLKSLDLIESKLPASG